MPEAAAGFWSYVQADDADEGGRILSLSKLLRSQYRLRTAEEFALFVDRESLEWGAEWNSRISEAITGTTFFIPVITPGYFRSQACRQELLKFTREAKRLGLEQLLTPIYWVTVPELDDNPINSSDEAVQLVARYQWQDFREVRLEDENSAAFRKAVSRLAEELAGRATQVAKTVHDVPKGMGHVVVAPSPPETAVLGSSAGEEDEEDAPGLLEKLAASEEGFSKLTEVMEEIATRIEEIGGLVSAAEERMRAAEARGQGIKARLVVTESLARQLSEPAGRIEELGHDYAAILVDLDPGVHAWIDMAALAQPTDESRNELLESIRSLASTADESLNELAPLMEATREAAKFSRSLRAPLRRMQTGLQGVLDGRAMVEDWGRRAQDINDEVSDRPVE